MRFYTYEHATEDRTVIDYAGKMFSPDDVEASCWIEAKQKFGYPLTTLQELTLASRRRVA